MKAKDGTGRDGWLLVVPVKHADAGKSRLGPYVGRSRPGLARAMTMDTITAAAGSPEVERIIVVTDDPILAHTLPGQAYGPMVAIVRDEPAAGLNPALLHGVGVARERHPGLPIAAMSGDLPALRTEAITTVLRVARSYPSAFVSDAAGTGTTLYAVGSGIEFTPRFGPGSAAAHRATGAVELEVPSLPSIRRDVDTEDDLAEALDLGVGSHTRELLASVGAVL